MILWGLDGQPIPTTPFTPEDIEVAAEDWFDQDYDMFVPYVDTGDYIIVGIEPEGDYVPAETPRVYTTEKRAAKVAEKMAKKYGGEFAVFKRIAVMNAEGAEYDA